MIYCFMFPRDPRDETPGPSSGQTALLPLAEGPCPTCAAFLDELEGAAEHVTQHVNLAVVAKTPLPRLLAFVEERGWRRLRFLSSANNTYSSELLYAPTEPGEDPRHLGTLEPLWNMLDLTPEGRPQGWVEQLQYD